MGIAGIGIAIFMALSLTITWLSGDKARGSLETKITEEQLTQERLEKDLKDARVKAANDGQLLRELERKLNAEIIEKKRLERALDIEEAQKRIAEQEGANLPTCSDKDGKGQSAYSKLEEKNRQDIAILEAKLKATTEAKQQAEQNLKELENFRTSYEKLSQQYAELSAQYAQANKEKQDAQLTVGLLQAAVKERSKGQVTSLESRLSSLEQNRMGLEGQLTTAMAAIMQLDETAARLESGLGTSAQPVEGMLKLQSEIESLRSARENVRLAMENVKGSMQSGMDTETIRMKSEIEQLSGSLEQIANINKGAGGTISLMGQSSLHEEPMNIKGFDDAAILNKKLQGLNLAIDSTFQETSQARATDQLAQPAGLPMTAGSPCVVALNDQTTPAHTEQAGEARADKELKESYTVIRGDSLWRIAAKKKIYGNPYLWPILYKYNLETIYHPDAIKPGYVLSIARNLNKEEHDIAIKKAKKHTKNRAKKGYIQRLRRELTEGSAVK